MQSRNRLSLGAIFTAIAAAALLGVASAGAMQDGRAPTGRTQPPPRDARSTPQRNVKPDNKFGVAQAPPKTEGAIRIAAYNMLNFFDQVDDPALSGEFDDIKNVTSLERCAKLAEAIRKVDADIIGLEEVESLDAVKWFRDTYLKDMGYKYICSYDVGYYRGVEQAVLSRIEITGSHVWLNESLDNVKRVGPGFAPVKSGEHLFFQRSPLMVNFKTEAGYEITIFIVHHKAGRDFDYAREAEALRIVDLINELQAKDPKRNIAVMGDFNAAPWDKSFRIYLQAGMFDTMCHRTTQGDDEAMLYKTHESNRVLDYILLNSAAHREFVPGSPFVLGTMFPPSSYDWRKDPPPAGYASDHYPVAIELMPEDRM